MVSVHHVLFKPHASVECDQGIETCRYNRAISIQNLCLCNDATVPRLEHIDSFHMSDVIYYGVRTNTFYFMVTTIPFPIKPVDLRSIITLKPIQVNTSITSVPLKDVENVTLVPSHYMIFFYLP